MLTIQTLKQNILGAKPRPRGAQKESVTQARDSAGELPSSGSAKISATRLHPTGLPEGPGYCLENSWEHQPPTVEIRVCVAVFLVGFLEKSFKNCSKMIPKSFNN